MYLSWYKLSQRHYQDQVFQRVSVHFSWLSFDVIISFHSCIWCRVITWLCWQLIGGRKNGHGVILIVRGITVIVVEAFGWIFVCIFFSLRRRWWSGWWKLILLWGCFTCRIGLGSRLPCSPYRWAVYFVGRVTCSFRSARRILVCMNDSHLIAHKLELRVRQLSCLEITSFRRITYWHCWARDWSCLLIQQLGWRW